MLDKHFPKAIKSLGQNFLHDQGIINKILGHLKESKAKAWLEIGCGTGAITKELIKEAKPYLGVELDLRMQAYLTHLKTQNSQFLFKDFLKLNEAEITNLIGHNYSIIGNLPYYITTPIIEKLLLEFDHWEDLYFMVQKEVALRIIDNGILKNRGRLTVFANFYANCEKLLLVKSGCFQPAPSVDSVFIHLAKKPLCLEESEIPLFFKLVKVAFSQRRKIMLNLIANGFAIAKDDLVQVYKKLDFKVTLRAEELSLVDWLKLFLELKKHAYF